MHLGKSLINSKCNCICVCELAVMTAFYLTSGQHRSLGPSISKVRSIKLDSSIWSNALVEVQCAVLPKQSFFLLAIWMFTCPCPRVLPPQLFLEVGNKRANSFWASNLPLEEEIFSGASAEQRATFIRRKYRERKYCRVLEGFHNLEQLNQVQLLF